MQKIGLYHEAVYIRNKELDADSMFGFVVFGLEIFRHEFNGYRRTKPREVAGEGGISVG